MEIYRSDCFAFEYKNKTFKCTALNVEDCRKCRFYKTNEQYGKEFPSVRKNVSTGLLDEIMEVFNDKRKEKKVRLYTRKTC